MHMSSHLRDCQGSSPKNCRQNAWWSAALREGFGGGLLLVLLMEVLSDGIDLAMVEVGDRDGPVTRSAGSSPASISAG
jgi:hypothetical protein